MNKQQLIDSVSTQLGQSKRDVSNVIEASLDELKRAVSRGEKVALSGFGVFHRQERAARNGRNPQTGEAVKIKATKLPSSALARSSRRLYPVPRRWLRQRRPHL